MRTPIPLAGEVLDQAADEQRRNHLLWILAAATFLIFFQAYMVAPLLPRLADVFGVSIERIGLAVPAYLLPYGAATLVYGPLSDRLGRRPLIFGSLAAFVLLTGLTAAVGTADTLLWLRLLTGLGASGVVPTALALVGDLFPYASRGRALGWLFGAMAGGMAFGSTVGALLEPVVTWRGLFLGVALLGAAVWTALWRYREGLTVRGPVSAAAPRAATRAPTPGQVLAAYWGLLRSTRGRRTYAYVLLNGIFHSGVFTWLGLYFVRRFALNEVGIGLALLGYGVPGFLLGPLIGRAADRWGRSRLIPGGLALGGIAAAALVLPLPVLAAAGLVTLLSLGYDMTQPLLAGIVTDLSPKRGLAMGLNVFTLFTGFGLGSLLFARLLTLGLEPALATFAVVAVVAAALAIPLFRTERRPTV